VAHTQEIKDMSSQIETLEEQAIRPLTDMELNFVSGGSIDSWLAGQPTIAVPPLDLGWTFKDVFAKHTIGR
jgi:hypothetical protein